VCGRARGKDFLHRFKLSNSFLGDTDSLVNVVKVYAKEVALRDHKPFSGNHAVGDFIDGCVDGTTAGYKSSCGPNDIFAIVTKEADIIYIDIAPHAFSHRETGDDL